MLGKLLSLCLQGHGRIQWLRASVGIFGLPEIEREVQHDVIAFLTNMAEYVGPASRFVHQGMTSSDLLDTAFALQIQEAGAVLRASLIKLLDTVEARAREHQDTVMIGRSHGIHWHVDPSNQVRYLADAKRETVYEVEMTQADGTVKRFTGPGPEADGDHGKPTEWRTMDCVDCHNQEKARGDLALDHPMQRLVQGEASAARPNHIAGV